MAELSFMTFPPMPDHRSGAIAQLGAGLFAASTGDIGPVAEEYLRATLGAEVAEGLFPVDTSCNLLMDYQRQLDNPPLFSVTTQTEDGAIRPACSGPEEEITKAGGLLDECGAWSMLGLLVTRAIGMNFAAMAVDRDDVGGVDRVALREVPAHHLYREPHPSDPRFPVQVWERRIRALRFGSVTRYGWTWDKYDLRGEPSFRIEVASGFTPVDAKDVMPAPVPGDDITGAVLGLPEYSPAVAYWPEAWRRTNGSPRYPFVFMHIEETGNCHPEVAAAGRLSATLAAVRTDGNAQKAADRAALGNVVVLVGVDMGTDGKTGDSRSGATKTIGVRPGTTILGTLADGSQAQSFELGGNVDLHTVYQFSAGYLRDRFSRLVGVSSEDNSGALANPESAGALSIKGSARRDYVRRKVLPKALRAFQELCAQVAALYGYEQDGYSVTLEGMAPSPSEQVEQSAADKAGIDAGLVSRIDVYRRDHPGVSHADAVQALAQVDTAEAQIKDAAAQLMGQTIDLSKAEAVDLAMAELQALAQRLTGADRQAVLDAISMLGGDVDPSMDEDMEQGMDAAEDVSDPPTSPDTEDEEAEDQADA